MIIKKMLLIISLLFASPSTLLATRYKKCYYLFKKFDIDPEVRSISGWKRIIKDDDLYDYLDIRQSKENDTMKKDLENCLINNGFNIRKYQRSIGNNKEIESKKEIKGLKK